MAAPPLLDKLQLIPSGLITCCDYHREYFERLQKNSIYYLRIYTQLLGLAKGLIEQKNKTVGIGSIWDFGCGQGLLGMVATASGWQNVGLIDMNRHCIENARKICDFLGFERKTKFQTGNEDTLQKFAESVGAPDIIVSTDVIEHVYQIESFLERIKAAAHDADLILTTGAIAENPLRSRSRVKLQIADELEGSDILQTVEGNPYAGLPFLKVRELIIERFDDKNILTENQRADLAKRTRGMNKKDIEIAAKNLISNGVLPDFPKHLTNTCDPMSSSWTERLLTLSEYRAIFEKSGYSIKFTYGLYNDLNSRGLKKLILKFLNSGLKITRLPQYGPYLVIIARPDFKK